MYKCVIVDDEELARNLMINHLSQLPDFELVAACESAIHASEVLKKNQIDLLFLDIEMPVLRGTDFYKNLLHKPSVIFTTAYREYAVDGFDLDAVDYLLKPITFARFFKAIQKFRDSKTGFPKKEEVTTVKDEFIFIRKDRRQVKVYFDDILYVSSVKDYIKIHLVDDNHLIKYSITSFREVLDSRFLRTHRSYIVNKDKITAYTKQDVEIGQIEIPIGESYKSQVDMELSNGC